MYSKLNLIKSAPMTTSHCLTETTLTVTHSVAFVVQNFHIQSRQRPTQCSCFLTPMQVFIAKDSLHRTQQSAVDIYRQQTNSKIFTRTRVSVTKLMSQIQIVSGWLKRREAETFNWRLFSLKLKKRRLVRMIMLRFIVALMTQVEGSMADSVEMR